MHFHPKITTPGIIIIIVLSLTPSYLKLPGMIFGSKPRMASINSSQRRYPLQAMMKHATFSDEVFNK
jgi:hypothetical protein